MSGKDRDLCVDVQYHTAGGTRVVLLDVLANLTQVSKRGASPS